MTRNEAVIYKEVPTGFPIPGQTMKKEVHEIDLDAPIPEGTVLLKSLAFSLDPYMRGLMRSPEIKSYSPAYEVGQPIVGHGTARVIKSNGTAYNEGQILVGLFPWKEYNVLPESLFQSMRVRTIDETLNLPPSVHVGAAGMPGATAWGALENIGKPKKGETIFISGAAGAVGQIVGALAKSQGLTLIGSAGSDEKVEFLKKELGFDHAYNYKKVKPNDMLKDKPIDIYWDNVGGEHLEAAIGNMNNHGRIILCGMISCYNGQESYHVKNLLQLVAKRILMQGFIIFDMDVSEFYKTIPPKLASGEIKYKEEVYKGLDDGESFLALLEGKNFGKAVIVLE